MVMPALVLVTMTVWQRRWLLYLVFALVVLLSLVHFFSFMTMIYSRGTANRPGQPNSMAKTAPNPAPEVTPRISGDAKGLRNTP